MNYVLNLAEDGRILSATYPKYAAEDAATVEILPEGDISDYLYIDGEYVYDPLPEPEQPEPATEPTVWDEMDAAYQEGVNSI